MKTTKRVKGFVSVPLKDRFLSKVSKSEYGCWEWTGNIAGGGYGYIHAEGKLKRAHRVSHELFVGTIPEGLNVLHTCDNRKCVNPAHLFVGTQKDNLLDCYNKGRRSWESLPQEKKTIGEKSHNAKLTANDVLLIRASKLKISERELARTFGVSNGVIHSIISGKSWKHLLPK